MTEVHLPGGVKTEVHLPALDGERALGFLAAVGVLRLVSLSEPSAALRWDAERGGCVLHSRLADLDAVIDLLVGTHDGLAEGQFWPDTPPGFPPPGAAPDALVPDRPDFAAVVERVGAARHVLSALVTDLAVNDKNRCRRTWHVAPTGKQSFSTMVVNQHEAVNLDRLREALSGWVRLPGNGESFDAGAISSGADAPDGSPGERPVPGATWLAVQALPALRLAGDGRRTAASGWRRVGRDNYLVWPLWRQPLTLLAVQALLEHPRLALRNQEGLTVEAGPLGALGVWAVLAAKRRPTGNADGPLVPVRVHYEHRAQAR